MKMNSVPSIILLVMLFASCATDNGDTADIAPVNVLPASCLLTKVSSEIDNGKRSSQTTYEYDNKNRLIKTAYGNTTIIYEYDQNDFLLNRTTRLSATYFITDKFFYKNEKIILIETNRSINGAVTVAKTEYEYDTSGNLFKIIKTDFENNRIESTYKNNILVEQTSKNQAFEINSLGLITKITITVSGPFSSAGQYSRYIFDKNGQEVKSENVDKNGVIVYRKEIEYSTTKDFTLNKSNYETNKGFPSIGNSLPKYMPKKDVTYLLDRSKNIMEEYISLTYENPQVDKNGLLLSHSSRVVEGGGKVTSVSNTTYTYTGCN